MFKQKLTVWVEEYLFNPNFFQKIISFFLLLLTFIYLLIIFFKRVSSKTKSFDIPVVSVGNLIVGGSGKTPITISLAKRYENSCVVLRGYGRNSKGLYVVSLNGKILEDVEVSGDEAMLLAKSLPKSSVIVSENRQEAILKAIEIGSKIVFLDDGFSKYSISKFDILLRPKNEPKNLFCLPSGGYREPKMMYSFAQMVLSEGKDFNRVIKFKKDGSELKELPNKLVIVTAISKAKRLLEFVPKPCELVSFPDHYNFTQVDIDVIKGNYKGFSIITTGKDLVKLSKFKIEDLILMDLEIDFDEKVDFKSMEDYIKSFPN